jgi:hypothetical protein
MVNYTAYGDRSKYSVQGLRHFFLFQVGYRYEKYYDKNTINSTSSTSTLLLSGLAVLTKTIFIRQHEFKNVAQTFKHSRILEI